MEAYITREFDTFPTEIYQNLTQIIDSLKQDNWEVKLNQVEQKCFAQKALPAVNDLTPPVINESTHKRFDFFRENYLKHFYKNNTSFSPYSSSISLNSFELQYNNTIGTIRWER